MQIYSIFISISKHLTNTFINVCVINWCFYLFPISFVYLYFMLIWICFRYYIFIIFNYHRFFEKKDDNDVCLLIYFMDTTIPDWVQDTTIQQYFNNNF